MPLVVGVEGFNRIELRGKGHVVSFTIRVNNEGKEWVVYHTEAQFKLLDNTLRKKSRSTENLMSLMTKDKSPQSSQAFGTVRKRLSQFVSASDASALVWHTQAVQPEAEGFLWKKTIPPGLEGFMWKKAAVSGIKGWNKRYFKLVGNTLFYSNDSTAAAPKRSIHILDATMIVPSSDIQSFGTGLVGGETLDGRASFEIRMPTQIIYLNALDRDSMETWVAKLNTAKRNRYSQSPPSPRSKSGIIDDMEIMMCEQKRVNYDIFLKSLCDYYCSTDYLNKFLLLNKYPNEMYPQYRMMVDALQSNFALIVDLHEVHGVPIDFEYKGVSFLSEACSVGASQVVEYILATETDQSIATLVNGAENYERTPLYSACSSACFEIANLLIASGATVGAQTGVATPLHQIARCAESATELPHEQQILETLVKSLAPRCLNAVDEYGQTPLHICVKKCNLALLPMLLNLGADFYVIDNTGKNVLHLVASNNSARAHAVMNELLQFIIKNVRALSDFTRDILLLEYCDNENKTALQYALVEPGCFRHVTLLQQHYLRLEEYRFSMLIKDLMQQPPNVVISEDKKSISSMKDEFSKTFSCIIEFFCASCGINEYHSDIVKLIEKTLDLCDRTLNVLRGLDLDFTAFELLEDELMAGIYPVIHSLFLKKNKFMDNVLQQNLLLFKSSVEYRGFGIPEKLWLKIVGKQKTALDYLYLVPTKVKPQDKLRCISNAVEVFECDGADDIVPCLAYIMVQGSEELGGVRWVAELEYITKLNPNGHFILLQGMISFLQSASLKKKNGIIFVESTDALATNTTHDLACLWTDLKKDENGMDEMQAIYSLFLKFSNNFSNVNEVPLDTRFSEATLSNHYMKSILHRLQITINAKDEQITAKYGDFVDQSIFAKIASSFANLPIF